MSKTEHFFSPTNLPALLAFSPSSSQLMATPSPQCLGQRTLSHSDSSHSFTPRSKSFRKVYWLILLKISESDHFSPPSLSHRHLLPRLITLSPNIFPGLNPSNSSQNDPFKPKVDHIMLLLKIFSDSPFHPEKKPLS